ncbi:hypothetical protein IEO70_04765 [Bacillus sp. AGMB 02131]|uniref:Glucosamine inositolphosphorylceramide transferase 1 N-terminal domain-containing protein n=1 Tax=Peribacillus faecalis TaxID=2772559 RepID=A0A927CUF1_9BACI|nr:hypothetical protein [Peribacillus faecalis]MBD3107671.1 hypothetical protein [Peribacillus faecalis]
MFKKKINFPIWSIKVFKSQLIVDSQPNQQEFIKPTLTAKDVTDIPADFIADPFLIAHESKYFMFFEVMNKIVARGEIGLATSNDGENWKYERIVLKEKCHLSYPYVFKSNNEFFMIPESTEANGVFLYKSKSFPNEWEKVCELIHGYYSDPSIFYYNEKWWMFAGSPGKLHLFFSNKIDSGWAEHPSSPLIKNNNSITRPAGRVIVHDGDIYRFTQDNSLFYGKSVRSFKIKTLSESEYSEEEVEIVLKGSDKQGDWRKDGMHQIDQLKINDNEWLIVVDGHFFHNENLLIWKLKRFLRNPIACTIRVFNGKQA